MWYYLSIRRCAECSSNDERKGADDMQGNIIRKIDYISEAFSLLVLLASDEGVAELERSLGKKYDLSGTQLRGIFDLLGQIEQEAHR